MPDSDDSKTASGAAGKKAGGSRAHIKPLPVADKHVHATVDRLNKEYGKADPSDAPELIVPPGSVASEAKQCADKKAHASGGRS